MKSSFAGKKGGLRKSIPIPWDKKENESIQGIEITHSV